MDGNERPLGYGAPSLNPPIVAAPDGPTPPPLTLAPAPPPPTPPPPRHRSYPFLLVDRVVELETQKYAVGYKNITVNDQFFNGHFPERAIMPGVLQVRFFVWRVFPGRAPPPPPRSR